MSGSNVFELISGSAQRSKATAETRTIAQNLCDEIIAIANGLGWERGRVERMGENEVQLRKCASCFLVPQPFTTDVYEALCSLFTTHDPSAPERLVEMPQVARYREGDHFDWHQDANEWVTHRGLTLSIQLSDPSEYDGGELELADGTIAPKARGAVFVFPADQWHRVHPITRGQRIALVAWSAIATNNCTSPQNRRNQHVHSKVQ